VKDSKYKDFLDILLTTIDSETGKGLDDLEILNEVDTFMVSSQFVMKTIKLQKQQKTNINTILFLFVLISTNLKTFY
jgi:hypothetical protein